MDISIIIVNLNTRQLLEACLASIYAHTCDVTFEVIVVDNHSADDSVTMVQTQFPQVRLIENTVNNRYAIANNQGLAVAKGKYILYVNSDVRFLGNAIKDLYQFLETDEKAGVVGAQLVYPDGRYQDSCFRFPSALNLFYLSCLARFYWKTSLAGNYLLQHQASPQQVDFVVGACCLARRDLLLQCHGMDPDYYLYGEDSDLCYRIRKLGWDTYYLPNQGMIIHHGGASTAHLFGSDQGIRRIGGWKSRFLFIKKHYSLWRKVLIVLAMFLGFGVNVLVYSVAFCKRRDWGDTRSNLQLHWNTTREAFQVFVKP